ncbi:MAG: NADH-quinone oxidoreductase subunit J [Solirubrobacterales bacterium]|nr:NADH-quinone oxidoreductase subunit J [Solirubrobacterales bacterium]
MSILLFFLASIGAIVGAVGVVALRNPFYGVLSLVAHLICLAVLFLLLQAEFLAAAQVIIYAGAVMVLYVFVVAYIGGQDESLGTSHGVLRVLTPIFVGVLIVELLIALLGSGLSAVTSKGAKVSTMFGSANQIGDLMLTKFLLPFEVASLLLLVAAIGAVGLARRRVGYGPGDVPFDAATIAAAPPAGTGTMAEASGDRPVAGFRGEDR